MKKKKEHNYIFNYIYNDTKSGIDFDSLLEELFKKYLIEYEK